MAAHHAAVTPAKGEPFEVRTRPTPKPGPGELLIQVKSVALNPADHLMRDQGIFIPTYPTVIGFDISGLVLEVGENVPIDDADGRSGPFFQPGITRVAAYAASFWNSYTADYGAFQERCLVPWQHAVPLPNEGISWNQAATLPVAVQVPLSAWDAMGLLRVPDTASSSLASVASTGHDAAGKDQNKEISKKDAILVWGASSSVGTMGVQTARLLREDHNSSVAAVYAVAGAANQEYVGSLGADRVFDYKDPYVVGQIVSAAKESHLSIRKCFLATGHLATCQAVLKAFLSDDEGRRNETAKIASAPVIPPNAEEVEGLETIFLMPSADERQRLTQFRYWMGEFLMENLANGSLRPSPKPTVVGKGLDAINSGLDMLLQGVSCTKLVVEVTE
ncbi:delta-aminolevulinic acid dehydratase protein [Colletotrichum truncatum]|uniref:Delta-aminolevulinic acid dehydratase protein n=1 Tax=Colletotrichum truncatum TaxID=5467 RepID=A0ACC3YKF4_COLTU|nr:delta-aminolevulinic acid dehydratase protein [Colletotrichum truncatum]KAF6798297.1 delta-aminolevulinic acid dehydratase protein [Colletotrichum truncatum]